jgi:arginine-tRNA-protein transferase
MSYCGLRELVVYDATETCPYLPKRIARMPLRLPLCKLTAQQLDAQLAAGDRRSGNYLYRTACPQCQACEPIRIDVGQFTPRSTQRRILRRGDRLLDVELGPPLVDRERVALFNAHRRGRGLARCENDGDIDRQGYAAFLAETCCDSYELRYRLQDRLVAVAVYDRGATSVSAVYCYFDPELTRLSLGTYSILKEIELCRHWNMTYLYLGYYIAESLHMNYKARFLPHQRLINGRWKWFR